MSLSRTPALVVGGDLPEQDNLLKRVSEPGTSGFQQRDPLFVRPSVSARD